MCHVLVRAYYSFNHGTHTAHFRVKIRDFCLEIDKTAGAYSLQINDLDTQQYVILRRRHGQVTKVPGQAPHITTE